MHALIGIINYQIQTVLNWSISIVNLLVFLNVQKFYMKEKFVKRKEEKINWEQKPY